MCVKERNSPWLGGGETVGGKEPSPGWGGWVWQGLEKDTEFPQGTKHCARCSGPQATAHVMGRGVEGPAARLCLLRIASYLYWVTAGLAFAEQWNVTTLSSSTGCGSTDRLTSGGSAERRDSLEDLELRPWFGERTRQGDQGRAPGYMEGKG